MPRRDTEQIVDSLWRKLRPHAVAALDAALAMPEPANADPDAVADEDSYIAERAAAQLARCRAKPASVARNSSPSPHAKTSVMRSPARSEVGK